MAAQAAKQTVLAAWARYEEEEIPDRSGPVLIGRCETTLVVRCKWQSEPRTVEDRREFVAAGFVEFEGRGTKMRSYMIW